MRKQPLLPARFRLERDLAWLALWPHIGSNVPRTASIEQCARLHNLVFAKTNLGLPGFHARSPAKDSIVSAGNKLIFALVVGLTALLSFGCTSKEPLPTNPLLGSPGQELIIRGQVMENNLGCDIDVACALRIETNGYQSVVIYHYGEWPPCPNEPAIRAGLTVEEGDAIEAFGIVGEGGGYISTCDSDDYYIKILQ